MTMSKTTKLKEKKNKTDGMTGAEFEAMYGRSQFKHQKVKIPVQFGHLSSGTREVTFLGREKTPNENTSYYLVSPGQKGAGRIIQATLRYQGGKFHYARIETIRSLSPYADGNIRVRLREARAEDRAAMSKAKKAAKKSKKSG